MEIKRLLLASFLGTSVVACAPVEKNTAMLNSTANWHGQQFRSYPELDFSQYEEDPDAPLWQHIRDEFALNHHVNNSRVNDYINWYLTHRTSLNRSIERATPFLYYVVEQVQERRMPMEIALLPMIESGYRTGVSSYKGASGLWQLMPATATQYGIKQNWWYDGRFDIGRSTSSALNYLLYLHNFFNGDWLLAIAAYNSGEGRVQQAIIKNRRRGLPTDFWSLDLPKQTRDYVPKLLALSSVISEPSRYGLTIHQIENKPQIMQVDVGQQVDLANAAKLAGLSLKELYQLNPGYTQLVTSPQGPHVLWLPTAAAERFKSQLEAQPQKSLVTWKRYRIQRGDSLSRIASKLGTSVTALREINQLHSNIIHPGQFLLYPITAETKKKEAERHIYTVKPGDSLWTIGHRYNLSISKLKQWNPQLTQNPVLHTGQTLTLYYASSPPASSHTTNKQQTYTVQPGDTLGKIALLHHVSIQDIKAWNQLKNAQIYPGQTLYLFKRPQAARPKPTAKPHPHAVSYTVQPGNTLASIAHRFGTTASKIAAWNQLPSTMIHPGQVLHLFPQRQRIIHVVQQGDTLYDLSHYYAVNVAAIKSWNHLKKDQLNVGEKLVVFTTIV